MVEQSLRARGLTGTTMWKPIQRCRVLVSVFREESHEVYTWSGGSFASVKAATKRAYPGAKVECRLLWWYTP